MSRTRSMRNMLRSLRMASHDDDDAPNTPSKSKNNPRRILGVYAIGLLFALVLGLSFFNKEVNDTYVGSHHRRALVAPLFTKRGMQQTGSDAAVGNIRQSGIENSELRQREALEILEKYLTTGSTPQGTKLSPALVSLIGGGGEVDLPKQQLYSANQLGNYSVPRAPATVSITVKLSDGRSKPMVVDFAKVEHLAALSDGLESLDLPTTGRLENEWWSAALPANAKVTPVSQRAGQKVPSAALATIAEALTPQVKVEEVDEQCKIYVLDVNTELSPTFGGRTCNISSRRVWPFARMHRGIDGLQVLHPQHYQYAAEYWISKAIRESSRYTTVMQEADFVFVDMWCYHTAWLAHVHPLGDKSTRNPEPYLRRSMEALLAMDRFRETKGGDFAVVQPNPVMKGLFSEETMCEDLASAYNMVPERSNLCVWTPDAPSEDKALVLPYVATLDLKLDLDISYARNTSIFFRAGCGNPHPAVRDLFAAGKMMRYELVRLLKELRERGHEDIHAECSCDICDNHMPHARLMTAYRHSTFCPVLPSNVQSSRRLSEVVLAGCIPVFIGPPFHSLPLADDIDYRSFSIFINVTNTAAWINDSSPNWQQNHMVNKMWKLDAPMDDVMVNVDSLHDAIQYLLKMSPEKIAEKRAAVLKERLKFYYGPVSRELGGDGSSPLGEILMRRMCRRAAAVKARMRQAAAEGVDIADSDVQINMAVNAQQQQQQAQDNGALSSAASLLSRAVNAANGRLLQN